jgi:hypothetical protein
MDTHDDVHLRLRRRLLLAAVLAAASAAAWWWATTQSTVIPSHVQVAVIVGVVCLALAFAMTRPGEHRAIAAPVIAGLALATGLAGAGSVTMQGIAAFTATAGLLTALFEFWKVRIELKTARIGQEFAEANRKTSAPRQRTPIDPALPRQRRPIDPAPNATPVRNAGRRAKSQAREPRVSGAPGTRKYGR